MGAVRCVGVRVTFPDHARADGPVDHSRAAPAYCSDAVRESWNGECCNSNTRTECDKVSYQRNSDESIDDGTMLNKRVQVFRR